MTKQEKIKIAKQIYDNLKLKRYSLEIQRDNEISADLIWVANMRGAAGLIIDDNGDYLFCQSAQSYEYWKEEFKKGIRSNKKQYKSYISDRNNNIYHCFRLTKGMDLKKEIESYAINNRISGFIVCSVGCLSKLTIRLADGKSILKKDGMFEIVSITGTLSKDGVHIHISVSDETGNTIGGHLKDGCIINTTAEIILEIFEDINFKREYDEKTGYNELIINN